MMVLKKARKNATEKTKEKLYDYNIKQLYSEPPKGPRLKGIKTIKKKRDVSFAEAKKIQANAIAETLNGKRK